MNATKEVDMVSQTKFTLKAARAMVNISQKEMAQRIGVAEMTYHRNENYESGMRIDKAYKFCEVVGLGIDEVLFYKN